uniref:Serine/threonine-protein kinase PBS1 n=1 Tax=Solanum tuberosum TaxID=4113 RepID=M1BHW7_SOLTU
MMIFDSEDVVKGMCKFNFSKSRKTLVSLMDYNILESATNKFQETEILGEGGFGRVYKAKLEDNLYVAVKKLTQNSIKEFEVATIIIKQFITCYSSFLTKILSNCCLQTEVELLSQMQHLNIISLLGYCIHSETRLLVYELMHNGSLETQLHGN